MTGLTPEERRRAFELRQAALRNAHDRALRRAGARAAAEQAGWSRAVKTSAVLALALAGALAFGQVLPSLGLHGMPSALEWVLPRAD
jgi:hypothetical protein